MSNASSSALNERIERLERQIASQRRHLAARTRITVVVALLFLVVLGGYFYFGYKNFDEVTRPEMVVQVAETFVDSNLPELRKSLQTEIVRSAPGWAEQLSKEAQSGMPRAREQLENYIENQMETMLDEASAFSQDQFRAFLKENRPALERGFQDLAASPTLAEETMKEVMDGLDKQLSKRMQLESSELFETLSMMKKKLTLLKSTQSLNNEQQLERRVLMLTRRLQLETVESSLAPEQVAEPKNALTPVVNVRAAGPAVEETGVKEAGVEEAAGDATQAAGDAKEGGVEKEKDAAAKEGEQAGEKQSSGETESAASPKESAAAKENDSGDRPE